MGALRAHSRRWSTKSSRPGVGEVEVLEDQHDGRRGGEALEERAPRGEELVRAPRRHPRPRSVSRAASTQRRSSSSGMCSARSAAIFVRVVGSSSPRQLGSTAHDLAKGPEADALAVGADPAVVPPDAGSTRPSTYLRNSQARRVLPMPAGPMTDTSRARPSRAVAWKRSLSNRSSSSRPTNGASSVSARFRPPRSATTRTARQAATGASLPLSVRSPAGSKTMALSAASREASPTSTVPGSAAPWRRLAVFTMSPATRPWFVAPIITAASPVTTPARAWIPGPSWRTASTSSRAARTARSASSSWAVGAPHTAITASPMNFSTVPPYRPITCEARVEVAVERLPHVLGVPFLGEGREADQVGEEDRDETSLGDCRGGRRRGRGLGRGKCHERAGTRSAELGRRLVGHAAGRADDLQRRPALQAEVSARLVLRAAGRTDQGEGEPSGTRWSGEVRRRSLAPRAPLRSSPRPAPAQPRPPPDPAAGCQSRIPTATQPAVSRRHLDR